MGKKVKVLEDHAHFLAMLIDIALWRVYTCLFKPNLTGGRFFQKVQAAQKGAFAGAGRADDDNLLPLVDGEADVVKDGVVSEFFN